MRIFAIDPSIRVTGVVVMEGDDRPQRLYTDRWLPPRKKDLVTRLSYLADRWLELREEWDTDPMCPVVIEVPGGHQYAYAEGGGGKLAIYGCAVGYLLRELYLDLDRHIVTVTSDEWIRGKPKKQRQAEIAMLYPDSYDPEADPGGDVSDAIGLCLWWQAEQKLKRAKDV